jgi:hypothetical protein
MYFAVHGINSPVSESSHTGASASCGSSLITWDDSGVSEIRSGGTEIVSARMLRKVQLLREQP